MRQLVVSTLAISAGALFLVALVVAGTAYQETLHGSCRWMINSEPTSGPNAGLNIEVDELLACRRYSVEEFTQALSVLPLRSEWFVFMSEHPFYVWYDGRKITAERHVNYTTRPDGGRDIQVFYTLPMVEEFRGLRSIAFGSCGDDTFPDIDPRIAVIYPCAFE